MPNSHLSGTRPEVCLGWWQRCCWLWCFCKLSCFKRNILATGQVSAKWEEYYASSTWKSAHKACPCPLVNIYSPAIGMITGTKVRMGTKMDSMLVQSSGPQLFLALWFSAYDLNEPPGWNGRNDYILCTVCTLRGTQLQGSQILLSHSSYCGPSCFSKKERFI